MIVPVFWLLDTNVVSEMMRSEPEQRVAEFLDAIPSESFGLSSVTVWEILNGIGRLDRGQRRDDIAKRFQELLDNVFEQRVLQWSIADASICARIMETKRQRGEPLDSHLPDAMIAATAVCHGLTIVTRNEREFRNTGANTVNPWTGYQA